MIKTKEHIRELINLLKERKVNLTHACQMEDFKSYLKLCGIPSRKLLSDQGVAFTPFESDAADKSNGVWDKSFCNLQDFGTFFHNSKMGVPTPYGPILISLDPEVLNEATDVAICLRSAGVTGFNRESESLDIENVEKIFSNAKDATYSQNIHITSKLKNIFKDKEVTSFPEVSVSLEKLAFGNTTNKICFIKSIIVDQINLKGLDLLNDVKYEASQFDFPLSKLVQGRVSRNQKFYDFLINEIAFNQRTFDQFKNTYKNDKSIDGNPKKMLDELSQYKTEYMYERFSGYLLKGTLNKVVSTRTQVESKPKTNN